ncbi:MAG: tRNA (adenosine(37)-N6)-dimethylallyltransferase MiaA [Pseudomonadota bacterium]|nr:tRNA (adenosine(37)-N6)-dimethylallyltransferase MiaA [Pseudomonadota bacterium]
MVDHRPSVIFVMGSTASGKTALACKAYDTLDVELINVDSVQVYQGMDVGSAKLSEQELAQYPHHLIDIRKPSEAYNASAFRDDAVSLIKAIHQRGKTPLFVGGTMLYFKALLEGVAQLPEADASVRKALLDEAEKQGWPALHQQLEQIDPTSAQRIKPKDGQRLQRALEVFRQTGETLTSFFQAQQDQRLDYPLLQIGLSPFSRTVLHERINERFDFMMQAGFLNEVERLRANPENHLDLPAFRSAGYKQLWKHLDGVYDLTQAVEKSKAITRQLAKRQVTWLRGWSNELQLMDTDQPMHQKQALALMSDFVHR